MDSQSGTNQLGYYSRNYGWVGPSNQDECCGKQGIKSYQ